MSSQIRHLFADLPDLAALRKKMTDIMREEASKCELKELVLKFIPEFIGQEIEKACHGIFPLQNVFIRKVKMLKKPKFDLTKLMEMYGDGAEDTGKAVAATETPAVETMAGSGGRL